MLIDGARAVPRMPVTVSPSAAPSESAPATQNGRAVQCQVLYGRFQQLENLPVVEGGSTMTESADFRHMMAKPILHKFEAREPAFGEVSSRGAAIENTREEADALAASLTSTTAK